MRTRNAETAYSTTRLCACSEVEMEETGWKVEKKRGSVSAWSYSLRSSTGIARRS